MSSGEAPAEVLVAYGDACATLTPRLKRTVREVASGRIVEVLSDDPSAREAVPAWCRLTGHVLVDTVEEDARRTRFFVRVK
ncbi:MAG TPA: sulfurtransferase TusA family protein [Dehalococcoidia bacterium]|nr:sulfurtransferase TusA family protein [Dehalococcoidia bacterium]